MRRCESVIGEETALAVARWVRLGDQVAGQRTAAVEQQQERPTCARCGTTFRVLDRGEQALCVRCYLERGPAAAH